MVFDSFPDRRSTESVKWRYEKFLAYIKGEEPPPDADVDVLPMWVADMDFLSPEPIIQALRERVDHGIFGYPGPLESIQEAVVSWLAKRLGLDVIGRTFEIFFQVIDVWLKLF